MEYAPYQLTIGNETYNVFPDMTSEQAFDKRNPKNKRKLGILVCSMYFTEPDMDKAVLFLNSNEKLTFWRQREFVVWLGGVVLNSEDERILHLANRSRGSFDRIGWRPRTSVSWEPTEKECEEYAEYERYMLDNEWEHLLDDSN